MKALFISILQYFSLIYTHKKYSKCHVRLNIKIQFSHYYIYKVLFSSNKLFLYVCSRVTLQFSSIINFFIFLNISYLVQFNSDLDKLSHKETQTYKNKIKQNWYKFIQSHTYNIRCLVRLIIFIIGRKF